MRQYCSRDSVTTACADQRRRPRLPPSSGQSQVRLRGQVRVRAHSVVLAACVRVTQTEACCELAKTQHAACSSTIWVLIPPDSRIASRSFCKTFSLWLNHAKPRNSKLMRCVACVLKFLEASWWMCRKPRRRKRSATKRIHWRRFRTTSWQRKLRLTWQKARVIAALLCAHRLLRCRWCRACS